MGIIKMIGAAFAWMIICAMVTNVPDATKVLGFAIIFAAYVAHNDG